jgi:peptide/nickel transport system substrate-binding protein
MFHSRWISSPEQPLGSNLMGFSDPRVDELLDRGIATYDQRERARIYRQLQDELAAARPALFGWAIVTVEALDKRLTYTDGEPDLGSRQWYWQIEKLVLRPD